MDAKQYYENGQLFKAIAAITEEVKQAPQNIYKRDFLRELLCVVGDYERADKQLDIIVQEDARAAVGAVLIKQLICAEQARQQCFTEGRMPEFMGDLSAALRWHLQALAALRDDQPQQAYEYLQKADTERLVVHGKYNGKFFNGIRDLDDTCASFFEVFSSNGKYYWIAFGQIKQIEFYAPLCPTDLIWRRAQLSIINGPEGEVFIPSIYVNTLANDEQARLGYKTDWQGGGDKPVIGTGQRLLLIGDEAVPIMEIKELSINHIRT
jgi:type VI secretion system protein ImpE